MYTFVQALIREVAYGTLARRDRKARHVAAARFFESLGDPELAGALAAHYIAAYRAAPEGPEGEAVAAQARISLVAAADRAISLGAASQAVDFLRQALEVTTGEAERADLLDRAGEAANTSARNDLAEPPLARSDRHSGATWRSGRRDPNVRVARADSVRRSQAGNRE